MTQAEQIHAVIERYFYGLHYADTKLLSEIFSQDCVLKTPGQRRTMQQWLHDIQVRPVPADSEHPWHYRVLRIDVCGEQAMVKIHCPLPFGDYVDFLGLLFEPNRQVTQSTDNIDSQNGHWRIVNKMYAFTPADFYQ